jgi:hypothetical protein
MTLIENSLEKVYFKLEPNDWHGMSTESMWCRKIGINTYELRNLPFYFLGIAFGDIFDTERINGIIFYKQIISRSGHSCYRFFLNNQVSHSGEVIEMILNCFNDMGVTYEKATDRLFSLDVPSGIDVMNVYNKLNYFEENDLIEFEEVFYYK